jgi:predicted ABC-class ATPase
MQVDVEREDLAGEVAKVLESILPKQGEPRHSEWHAQALRHAAVSTMQDKIRRQLMDASSPVHGVAFIANGAILPRKNGASADPMASPPAVPFGAPENSSLACSVTVDLGPWHPYLDQAASPYFRPAPPPNSNSGTLVTLHGLLVKRGITWIVGGGYHGKSTLLRCIAAGVYNKIPGDGREFCVTVPDALSIRAEDGRCVNNCNVSAFISNLPTFPLDSIETTESTPALSIGTLAPPPSRTQHFSTGEASGSTSQAANVAEAIELGVTAMLVDEDVSAANFMARDGRMRALVMDESITPLLYRVNGMFTTLGISTVVVVGGVGDWLDVPHHVLMMDRYRCLDATAKARSISKQFSHGHVQYSGRGVVHRLEWEERCGLVPMERNRGPRNE